MHLLSLLPTITLMTWVSADGAHLALAAVFGSAAVAKARTFPVFADYLHVPSRWMTRIVAGGVIGVEVCLAAGLLVIPQWQPVLLATGAFVLAASAFLAWRLISSDETGCQCWGVHGPLHPLDRATFPSTHDILAGILAPTWFGIRNGTLLLGTWLLLERAGTFPFDGWGAFVSFSSAPVLMLIGMAASIAQRRHYLTREEHPAKSIFASRLAPVVALSCRGRALR